VFEHFSGQKDPSEIKEFRGVISITCSYRRSSTYEKLLGRPI
jgi:hypothetical protein